MFAQWNGMVLVALVDVDVHRRNNVHGSVA
jgi:hypothetical protein